MLTKFNPAKTRHLTLIHKILAVFFHTPKASAPLALQQLREILVLDFTLLGDMVMLTPFLQTLKKNCPRAKISLVCSAGGKEILKNQQLVERFFVLDGKVLSTPFKMLCNWRKIYRVLRQINQFSYDVALEPRGDLRHIFFMHFCNAGRKAAYTYTGGEYWLTDAVTPSAGPVHLVEDKMDFLKQLGFSFTGQDMFPRLVLTPRQKASNQRFLQKHRLEGKTIIGLHPGASQRCRQWPFYAELLSLLTRQFPQAAFLVFQGPGEQEQAAHILQAARKNHAHAVRVKTTLAGMLARLACCNLVVCNDSGAGHMAAALGVEVLVLFGPGNPVMVRPYNPGNTQVVVAAHAQPCQPCGGVQKCTCPPECLTAIPPQQVLDIILKGGRA